MVGDSVPQGRARQGYHLRLFFLASVLAPLLLFATHAWQSYDLVFAQADERLQRRVAVLSEHVARIFETQSTVVELIISKLEQQTIPTSELGNFLNRRLGQDAMVSAIIVLDGDGTVLASTLPIEGRNVADREYFYAAMAKQDLIVAEQIRGRFSNETVFTLARGWRGGVVAIGLFSRYFEDIFLAAAGEDAEAAVAGLYRADGALLARAPLVGHASEEWGLMTQIPSAKQGAYRDSGLVDDDDHLHAFHQIGDFPVWVTLGVKAKGIRNEWLRGLIPHGLLSLAVSSILGVSFILLWRRERQAGMAEKRLQQAVTERTAEALDAISARKEALAVAERANRAKSHFLASASHDLRQPIQGVRLFLDVLEGRLEDQFDRHVLSNAVKALEGAESLLSTLLDVSTLEAGMIRVAARAFPLQDVLSNLADEFAKQAGTHGLSFRFVSSGLWVETDPVLLARVLRNLLTNAVRYTKTGRILLGCRRQGAQMRVEVWDTGEGIPGDKLETVFEDFVQIGNPERDRAKGLGLGLAVVRRMAVLLGHRVGVRSHLGRGTVFWITLPVVPAPIEQLAPPRMASHLT